MIWFNKTLIKRLVKREGIPKTQLAIGDKNMIKQNKADNN